MGGTDCGEGLALGGQRQAQYTFNSNSADEWGCAPSLLVVWPEATQSRNQ